jgi:hypothetical protein
MTFDIPDDEMCRNLPPQTATGPKFLGPPASVRRLTRAETVTDTYYSIGDSFCKDHAGQLVFGEPVGCMSPSDSCHSNDIEVDALLRLQRVVVVAK